MDSNEQHVREFNVRQLRWLAAQFRLTRFSRLSRDGLVGAVMGHVNAKLARGERITWDYQPEFDLLFRQAKEE